MPNIGPTEIIVVLVVMLLIFGPRRLPDLGRSIGRGIREFKDSVTGEDDRRKQIEESGDAVAVTAEQPVRAAQATDAH